MPLDRLILLTPAPLALAGSFSARAWQELGQASVVVARDASLPEIAHLASVGLPVELLREENGDPRSDGTLAADLLGATRQGTAVLLLGRDGDQPAAGSSGLTRALANELARSAQVGEAPELELLPAIWEPAGASLLELVAVMDRLRSPGGCPWDAEQTSRSLVTYLLEETYETIEAIETDDFDGLREELGDLLLQVVFHARVAEERATSAWSIDDVARGITEKLRRRHPDVFAAEGSSAREDLLGADGRLSADGLESMERTWQQQKTLEKSRTSVLDGVPQAQPALSLAAKMISRVERGGLEVPISGSADAVGVEAGIGAELLAVVARAREAGVDPEAALREAVRTYADRVRVAEAGPDA